MKMGNLRNCFQITHLPTYSITNCFYGKKPRSSGSGPAMGTSNNGGTAAGNKPTLSGSIVKAPPVAKNGPIWSCGSMAMGEGSDGRNVCGFFKVLTPTANAMSLR